MRKRITETYLKDYVWWWTWETKGRRYNEKTHTICLKPGSRDAAWKSGSEIEAFRYELAKRHDRSKELPPYAKAREVAALLADERQRPFRLEVEGIGEIHDDYHVKFPDHAWNLLVADDLLASAFLTLVKSARREKGVERSSGPEGRRNRPVSWRWVELIDIDDLIPARPLSKSERDTLRKARSLAKHSAEYLRAMF